MTPSNRDSDKRTAIRLNRATLWISRHWLRVVLIIVGIYASLPWVAPTLMKIGLTGPARVIYTLYSPFCHQFAFRTFFLYGEQPAYPREVSGTSQKSFEDYVKDLPEFAPDRVVSILGSPQQVGDIYAFTPGFQGAAREFLGNEQMGYKTALCERDVAIYGAIFIGGLLYSRVRYRLRPVPIWLYILLGIAPIGLDGLSQLLSAAPFYLWPQRETLPIFRVVTGALFGFMNAWLIFPHLERSMYETRQQILAKFARAGVPVKG